MSTFFPNQSYYYSPLASRQQSAGVTITSGNTGGIYEGLGDDFLDPDKILNDINDFSNSIKPITSPTWTSLVVPGSPFNKNADSAEIGSKTNRSINSILKTNYLNKANFRVPVLQGPFIQPVPDFGANPDSTRILLSTLFFTNGIQASQGGNPGYSPYFGQSPSSNDILWGTQQAQNNILNGFGFPSPFYSPFQTSFRA